MKKKFFNFGLNFFKEHKLTNSRIIAAVSGGLDSVVLLDLLNELSRPCQLTIWTAYIHHGSSSKKSIQNYRDKAEKLVRQISLSHSLEFICSPQAKKILKNEEELRKFRHHSLKRLLKQKQADWIALAHNKNDLLETRLIQLIRGCGPEGLKSMRAYDPPFLRPLLEWSRSDIQKYARQKKLLWQEDPSNRDNQPLRNWIRNQWLPQLENKRAGANQSLARSLQSLCHSETKGPLQKILNSKGIKRRLFMELPVQDQKRLLAFYMRSLRLSNYGQSHISEILKLSERKEKNFSAKILKKTWFFSPEYIHAK